MVTFLNFFFIYMQISYARNRTICLKHINFAFYIVGSFGSLSLGKERGLRVLENTVLRRIFGP